MSIPRASCKPVGISIAIAGTIVVLILLILPLSAASIVGIIAIGGVSITSLVHAFHCDIHSWRQTSR